MYTVIYDDECGLCRRVRTWVMRQDTLVPLEFLPLHAPDLYERFTGLEAFHPETEIVVIGDDGDVYQGAGAWIMLLYAMRNFRHWSFTLSTPRLMPLARKLVYTISANRLAISNLLGWSVHDLEALPDETHCTQGSCTVSP